MKKIVVPIDFSGDSVNALEHAIVIANKFPAYVVKHPNKVVWLFHQHREIYDFYETDFTSFTESEKDHDIRLSMVRIDQKTLGEAKKLFSCSKNVAERLQKYCGIESEVLHHPPKLFDKFKSTNFENYFLALYRIDHSKKVPGYLQRIESIIERGVKTYVLWVHGITDDVATAQGREHQSIGLFHDAPENLHALVGYGQGGDPKTGETESRLSARSETVEAFCDHLCAGGLTTVLTHPAGSNYRGRDAKRLNQWFNQQGYGLDRVESMHLEIREKGFRDTDANAVKTAKIIAVALNLVMKKIWNPQELQTPF